MMSAIRILFISLLLSIFLVAPSIAGTILYGNVRINQRVPFAVLMDAHDSDHFPFPSYKFRPDAHDLKYDEHVPLENRVKDLSVFKLPLNATLTLISFDKHTKVAKFKLNLTERNWLDYVGGALNAGVFFETGGSYLKGDGSLKLANGENPEFIIEGKLETLNGKPHWISFNRNKYFDIEIENAFGYAVRLKLLQDFPVIVSS
jgi:hypothetical protein